MPTTDCHRCRLLETECWRLSQRLMEQERRLAQLADDLALTRWVTKRLAQTLGERALAGVIDPEPAEDEA